jgi:hypothetical protein
MMAPPPAVRTESAGGGSEPRAPNILADGPRPWVLFTRTDRNRRSSGVEAAHVAGPSIAPQSGTALPGSVPAWPSGPLVAVLNLENAGGGVRRVRL